MKTKFFASSILIFALMSACGGTSTPTAIDRFEETLSDVQAQANRLNQMSPTAFRSMPVAGSAVFEGYASMFIDPVFETDDDDIIVLGDARLTANFGSGRITGAVTNMSAAVNFETVGQEERFDVVPVDGRVVIGRGESVIGDDFDDNRTNRPNDLYADYRGDLTIEGDQYQVGGAIKGQFLGTRVNPASGQSSVRGLGGGDLDGYAAINGAIEEVPLSFEIIAENR